MLRNKFKIVGFGIALLISSTSFAQIVDQVKMVFETGNRGLAHTVILKVELLGGGSAEPVLATGEINPPEPAGFPANSRSSAELVLDRQVNLRLVNRARLSVRGDRPGQNVTTSWDVKSIRVDLKDGETYLELPPLRGVVLNAGFPIWTTTSWSTYDATGYKTKLLRMNLDIKTGADDLRSDAGAGAIIQFNDGSTYRVNICGQVGMAANSKKSFPFVLNSPQSLNDVHGVYMFHNAYLDVGGFDFKVLNLVNRFTNADGWDVTGADLSGTLSDRTPVRRSFNRLLKHYSGSVGFDVVDQPIIPTTPVRDARTLRAKIFVFIDGTEYDPTNKNELPEVVVYFRFKGSAVWDRFITRTSPSQVYMAANGPAMWANAPEGFSGFGIDGPKTRTFLAGTSRLWLLSFQPVAEIQVRLVNGPGPDSGTRYGGSRTVKIRGFWFGYVPEGGPDRPRLDQMVSLGSFFHDPYELNRTRWNRSYTVNHLMPPTR